MTSRQATRAKKLHTLCRWTLLYAKGCPQEVREAAFDVIAPNPGIEVAGFIIPGEVYDELVTLAEAGKKIQAIKRFREATGASLKDAKDAVERSFPFPSKH
jgi:ribosomal protein L7/L12